MVQPSSPFAKGAVMRPKLTENEVRRIRQLAERRQALLRAVTKRYGGAALARRFHTSTTTIERVVRCEYIGGRAMVIAPAVMSLIERRKRLRTWISHKWSNDALARRFGVHVNTVINATTYGCYRSVR